MVGLNNGHSLGGSLRARNLKRPEPVTALAGASRHRS